MLEIDADTATAWVRRTLGCAPDNVVPLSGGVSSTVLLVECAGRRLVLKQALPQLRVTAEWFCDQTRAMRESAALKHLASVLPPGAVPEVIAEDPASFAFLMTAAPSGTETWKSRLMRGLCEVEVAEEQAVLMARIFYWSRSSAELAARFADIEIFHQLRVDAYYRYTAERHADLRDYFQALSADCHASPTCLVHGDWSPKNILTDGARTMVIDWECVHFGTAAFDPAFLLNHLLLKSFYLPGRAGEFAELGIRFWQTLIREAPEYAALEDKILMHWAGLLLARIDGKSPVEYITESASKEALRRLARDLMRTPAASVAAVFDRSLGWH